MVCNGGMSDQTNPSPAAAGAEQNDLREEVLETPTSGETAGYPADNIRDQQGTHAGGAVPPSFVGSGDDSEDKPEDPADNTGLWDDLGREKP